MSKDMLGIAVRKLVTLPGEVLGIVCDLLEKLSDPEWVKALKRFLRKENPWANAAANLLEFVGTVVVSATTSKFVAKDKFKVDTSDSASVKISYLGNNFRERFLGKTEDPITEQTLHYAKLRQSSVDDPIIAELGGEEKAETTLSAMFSLMELQGHGQDGVLLTNGYANVFYIRDINGVLCAVRVHWYGGGWDVDAYSIEDPLRWGEGFRVFSRN